MTFWNSFQLATHGPTYRPYISPQSIFYFVGTVISSRKNNNFPSFKYEELQFISIFLHESYFLSMHSVLIGNILCKYVQTDFWENKVEY